MSNKAHWMRPLAGKISDRHHILIYVEEMYRDGRVKSRYCHMWHCVNGTQTQPAKLVGDWYDVAKLDAMLLGQLPRKGQTMVWLVRGWEDLVLSGLAELIDSGVIQHKYAAIDGHKVLIRGVYHGRGIVITSLGNWYGGSWRDACKWDDSAVMRGVGILATQEADQKGFSLSQIEQNALQAWANVLSVGAALDCGNTAPTVGSQAIRLWRAWLGPRVEATPESSGKGRKSKQVSKQTYVAPLTTRPEGERNAERHAAYALETRQYGSGKVTGPIYCSDLHCAYLHGLITTPIPVQYLRTITDAKPLDVAEHMCHGTALALVLIQSRDTAYPARRNGVVTPTVGTYWTWLCGTELCHALCMGQVQAVHTAHLWSAVCYDEQAAENLKLMTSVMEVKEMRPLGCLWRIMYAALVGRMAAWRRVWREIPCTHQFGRWSLWHGADPDTGQIVAHRSIAGKCERLAERRDTSDSVPLLYAVVTARVRYLMRGLLRLAGDKGAIAMRSDEMWLTQSGYESLCRRSSELGLPPDMLPIKCRYDHVWLTGKSVAVVEHDGQRHLLTPGLPVDATADRSGKVSRPMVDPWNTIGTPKARKGVRVRLQTLSVDSIISKYGYAFRRSPTAVSLNDTGIPSSLLEPLSGKGRVDDER